MCQTSKGVWDKQDEYYDAVQGYAGKQFEGGQMNLDNIVITPLQSNPADYNIKADILNDEFVKVADFGVNGIDMFTWWVQQDDVFRLSIVNQFIVVMAQEIVSGQAE